MLSRLNFVHTRLPKKPTSYIHIKLDMSNKAINCYAQPISSNLTPVTLPHNEVICIGRNRTAVIRDTFVSKTQLTLKADYENNSIECICKGPNPSGCNGFALRKDVSYTFAHGDRVEVMLGRHVYKLIFEYPNDKEDVENPKKKIKLQDISIPDNFKGDWQFIENSLLIYTPNVDITSNCVASFDLDGTLITTKSGQKFPKDFKDWALAFGSIQKKLKDLYLNGYRIVIFSNQYKLGQEKSMIPHFKEKVEDIIQKIGIPIQVFLATQKDIFRKPALGMWNTLLDLTGINVDMNESFYVGDAAGRAKNWAPHKSKDHSIADRLFTLNVGLKFFTPEEYFLSARCVPYAMPEFDPRTVSSFPQTVPTSTDQEVIIMVGSQGSGKSYFCKNNLVRCGYFYINRDTLGTKQKCLKTVEECLKLKKSVVIDNTNPDVESRKPYIELCKKYKVTCKCFHMNVPHKHCKHNNKFRSLTDKSHIPVNDIIINSYRKKFQEPTLDEGFTEIHEFKFNASFKSNDEEKLYKMFLLET